MGKLGGAEQRELGSYGSYANDGRNGCIGKREWEDLEGLATVHCPATELINMLYTCGVVGVGAGAWACAPGAVLASFCLRNSLAACCLARKRRLLAKSFALGAQPPAAMALLTGARFCWEEFCMSLR